MPDIFINFRKTDEPTAATVIERDLVARFGRKKIFRDSSSIPAGEDFAPRILSALRSSHVLLAVIGPRWLDDERLKQPEDWVRRELLEAKDRGIRVIPVLVGEAHTLNARSLPRALTWLANRQWRRFRNVDAEADLARIAQDLVEFVPGLVDRTKVAPKGEPLPPTGTVINNFGNHGPVHGGIGTQNNDMTRSTAGETP